MALGNLLSYISKDMGLGFKPPHDFSHKEDGIGIVTLKVRIQF